MAIPKGITSEHVLQALRQLERGVENPFGDSVKYDLVHRGHRYPPKAVVGLASRVATGADLRPEDFSGGEAPGQANAVLRELGFEVAEKEAAGLEPSWALAGEGKRRWAAWKELGAPDVDEWIPAQRIRQTRLYYGAQGVFVDKARTSTDEYPEGITVSVLHTGSSYPDELSDRGILYHYPSTQRPASRDAGKVQATKNAKAAGIPIVVITRPTPSANVRNARWGWVEDSDDQSRFFYISFGTQPTRAAAPATEERQAPEAPFTPTAARNAKKRLAATRPGQGKFRFDVFKRYGPECAVCDQSIPELLEAAHIVAKEFEGCDDPRNGLVLCRNHHRAFDKRFFQIEPSSLRVITGSSWSTQDLGVRRETIQHLPALPAREALAIVFGEKSR